MPKSVVDFSLDLPVFAPAFRPSQKEVETYARAIATADGDPPEMIETHFREAELQLWLWRSETGQRPARNARRPSTSPQRH